MPGCRVRKEDGTEGVCDSLGQCIERAKKDWLLAKMMLDQVTGVEQVDAAIYRINACERKYIYLLKIAKAEKLKVRPSLLK